jgi:uncharacterized phage protein (TIGR01671 family)
MSRVIKFRAWVKQFDKMINDAFITHWNVSDGDRYMVNREWCEVMQFTGLKDKNGKEIYEGDIVKFLGMSLLDTELKELIGKVEWNNELLKFDVVIHQGPIPDLRKSYDDNNFEVIGNIYENPELLTH